MKNKTLSLAFVSRQALLTAIAVAVSVALPQLCHLLGAQLGYGTSLGEMLLPMHLPVMLAGLLWGPWVGLGVGFLSPLTSFALTGMPLPAMLPFMTIELVGYGLCAGLLSRHAMPTVCKVLVAQVAGRALRAVALLAAVGMEWTKLPISLIWTSITVGVAGIAIQLILVPALLLGLERAKLIPKRY